MPCEAYDGSERLEAQGARMRDAQVYEVVWDVGSPRVECGGGAGCSNGR